jgi:soluble lytic murein transglycosylase-like protein
MCAFSSVSLFALVTPAQAAQRVIPATPLAVAAYARVLARINPAMPRWQSRDLAKRVLISAVRWRIDATMLVAIVTVESRWHTHAVSATGAIGLGQLMPGTAALLRVNPRDPAQNLSGAARYLRGLVGRYGHRRYDLVFAAYNAGPHAVGEYGGVPPYGETQQYVVRVLSTWQALSHIIHVPAAAYDSTRQIQSADAAYWLEDSKIQ